MAVNRSLIPVAVALLAVGCSDSIGVRPPADLSLVSAAPHFLRWAGPTPPRFRVLGAHSGPVTKSGLLASAPGGLSLEHNTATFWAVRGQQRSVQINYLSSTGNTSFPFLRLAIADPTYLPGQGPLAPGDSVLITVTVDTAQIAVSLTPTGLVFGDPAQLQIWYGGAGGDLNGDGVVDSTDAYIASHLLGMWYREGADSAWTPIPAVGSLSNQSFASALPHFCDYSVSWSEYAVSW